MNKFETDVREAAKESRAARRVDRQKAAVLRRKIVTGRKSGLSYRRLAQLSGLSEIRISQILTEGGATKSRTTVAA